MTPEELDAVKARCEAATPGPWRWGGSLRDIRLDAMVSNRPCVMAFARHGMYGAQPVFWDRIPGKDPTLSGAYRKAKEIAVREVPYREDIVALTNADAIFIAHARADVDALLAEVDRLRATK